MVSRHDLMRFLDGHRTADAVLRRMSLERVVALTVDEARTEYDSLCRVWEASRAGGNDRALDARSIADRVALRRRLRGSR